MKLKLSLFLCAAIYFFNAAYASETWHIIDNVNLVIHEAGHTITMFFGEFIYIAGGSLLQIIFPLLFAFYFWRRSEVISTGIMLLWTGESMVGVGIYAADAIDMQLPLLGGDGVIHDWNYLLTHTGLLAHAHGIGAGIISVGYVVMSIAVLLVLTHAQKKFSERVVPETDAEKSRA